MSYAMPAHRKPGRPLFPRIKVGSWAAALTISALIWVALILTGYAIWEWVTR